MRALTGLSDAIDRLPWSCRGWCANRDLEGIAFAECGEVASQGVQRMVLVAHLLDASYLGLRDAHPCSELRLRKARLLAGTDESKPEVEFASLFFIATSEFGVCHLL